MKHSIVRAITFVVLSLGLSVGALAQNHRTCTTASMAGDWGYTKTGTVYTPAGATPFATVGILTLYPGGGFTGVNTGSVGGALSRDALSGTFEVYPDCTGRMTVEVYNSSGILLRTLGMDLVVDDTMNQLRGLVTSLALPNGMNLSSVITAEAKRVFKSRDAEN